MRDLRHNLFSILSCGALVALFALGTGCSGNAPADDDTMGDDDDDTVDGGPTPDGPPSNQNCESGGFGTAWTGHDNLPASMSPPCGLSASAAPMFVSIGFDDNGDAEGMTWALDMLKDRDVHTSFYMTSVYGQSAAVVATWKRAYAEGHEIGNHTVSHLPSHGGHDYTADQWQAEIGPCSDFLSGSADVVPQAELYGFRTPYLEYDDALLATVHDGGFWYDCSIEEGYEDGQDGSNSYWPYTLDNKSPGHTVQVEWMDPENPIKEIEAHPGLWEMPVYAVFVPPDSKCAEYGVPTGMRAKMKQRQSWFDEESGSITGFDYNLWASVGVGGFEMTKAEYLATMKYTFDQHYNGNHAPLLFGSHTAYYVDSWSTNAAGTPNASDRRAAVEEFLDYVKGKQGARIESHKAILDWIRNPTPL
jgi:peptidoglycan/xylan/chitin deacetylase (PgdA/CDA1 family)